MGVDCCGTCDPNNSGARIPYLDKKYKEMDLPVSVQNDFNNKFEHDFFMTFNILRTEPESFQTYIKNYMATGNCKFHPVAAKVLISKLKEIDVALKSVNLNKDAANSCLKYLNLKGNSTEEQKDSAVDEFRKNTKTNLDIYEIYDHLEMTW